MMLYTDNSHQSIDEINNGPRASRVNGRVVDSDAGTSNAGTSSHGLHLDDWIPPGIGHFKINFDIAFTNPDVNAGIGLILRDHAGYCWGIKGIPCRVVTVDEGEAVAAIEAEKWVEELSMNNIIIEGDSSNIIGFLKGSLKAKDMDWRAVNILKKLDSYTMMRSQQIFEKVSRSANKAADAIAKAAKNWEHPVICDQNNIPSIFFEKIGNIQ